MDSSFCSNFARKEATPLGPLGEMPADMTEASSTVSKCNAGNCGCGVQVKSEAWLGRVA